MTHPCTWLAIVDGEHARFVMHDVHGFHTVHSEISNTAGQRTAELVSDRLGRSFESAGVLRHAIMPKSDRLGRSFESVGTARHAIAPHSDPHTREKQHFAALIAAELNTAAAQSHFARLILAGPSRTLQAVEEALDPGVRRRIAGRVAKSLAKVPDQDLGGHFPAWPLV
mgnify:CR=1 FL=1